MKSQIIKIKTISDSRGDLSSLEESIDIPIDIKRVFYMHHVCENRGGHAHIDTDQVVIAISGSFKIELFDGVDSLNYLMDDCTKALYIPRLTFTSLYDFSADAVCLVLANTYYDMNKSLRNMSDFLGYIEKNNK